VLTHALDETEWPVTAALWLFFSESNQWRLIFASPTVNKEGPGNAYKHIQTALRNLPTGTSSVGLQDIAVIDASAPVVELLSTVVKTGEDSIAGIRFSENVINGHLIEDAYIYRMT
jgi:hypothetical protein